MYVMNTIAKNPDRELTYYFPIGHNNSPTLDAYRGKYSSQADFLLFKDQSSCIVQDDREKIRPQ